MVMVVDDSLKFFIGVHRSGQSSGDMDAHFTNKFDPKECNNYERLEMCKLLLLHLDECFEQLDDKYAFRAYALKRCNLIYKKEIKQ